MKKGSYFNIKFFVWCFDLWIYYNKVMFMFFKREEGEEEEEMEEGERGEEKREREDVEEK